MVALVRVRFVWAMTFLVARPIITSVVASVVASVICIRFLALECGVANPRCVVRWRYTDMLCVAIKDDRES